MITKVCIDDMPPEDAVRELEYIRQNKRSFPRRFRSVPEVMHPMRSYGDHDDPGVLIKKLLDWRSIERRAHEIGIIERRYTDAYWDALKDAWKACKERKGSEVWVLPVKARKHKRVMTFDGRSQCFSSHDDLIKQGIGDPDRKAYIIKDEEAAMIWRDFDRKNVTGRRRSIFFTAFRFAVELRLRPFVGRNMRWKDEFYPDRFRFHRPASFMLANEGRQYIIRSDDRGQLSWHDDAVYECT